MFFGGWGSLLRTLVVGALAYVSLIVFLRVSGKRTLSKMNAFDLIVTVALGSTLATVLLSKDVALAEGATTAVPALPVSGARSRAASEEVSSACGRRFNDGHVASGAGSEE